LYNQLKTNLNIKEKEFEELEKKIKKMKNLLMNIKINKIIIKKD
jgi:hypothetical protein